MSSFKVGVGEFSVSIPTARAVIAAIQSGALRDTEELPIFGLQIPKSLKDVDATLLNPTKAWSNVSDWGGAAKNLVAQFVENFKKYDVSDAIVNAGPQL
ncbi:MAG: hypothetical protein CSH37_13180 [Thalassolituus sp.]|jgi:phosphoenolpyruvate carboxykinase (ATP)|nr:MAG: hypothetical protein CSH37_13180 [Thalassolituus sp.]|tara:strand:+ start:294 stop:590 length:297 start_codon:yes stop_codon:yes gene_type:complete